MNVLAMRSNVVTLVRKGWRLGYVLAALWLLGASACAGRGHNYHDAAMDFGAVKTVVVMPFVNLGKDPQGAERVRDVFANMLLASGAVYVLPAGEVARGISRTSVQTPTAPSAEEVVKLGTLLKADAVITGVVREYGQVGTGSSVANVVSFSVQLLETTSGKVVWSASSTQGGVTVLDRLLGSSAAPINDVTEMATDDLLSKLFD